VLVKSFIAMFMHSVSFRVSEMWIFGACLTLLYQCGSLSFLTSVETVSGALSMTCFVQCFHETVAARMFINQP